MNSTKFRTAVKSFTWRIVATISTFFIGLFMTDDVGFATTFTIFANIINFTLFYIHERIWLQIRWGRHE